MNKFTINLSELSSEMRCSVKHNFYKRELSGALEDVPTVQLRSMLVADPQYGAGEAGIDMENENDIRYIRITDIDEFGYLSGNDKKTAEKINLKYLLKHHDFLIARSGNTVGKSFLYDKEKHEKAIFAGYFIKFEVNPNKINPKFLFYYTKSRLFETWKNSTIRVMGQPNINAEEYKGMPVPLLPIDIQDEIVEKLIKIEAKVIDLKTRLSDPLEIINNVFAEEFKYSYNIWKEFGKGMTAGTQRLNARKLNWFSLGFENTSNNKTFRFSSRFHNPSTRNLYSILKARSTKKLKEVLIEPVNRGVLPKVDIDGDVYVIKTGQLKNGKIDITEAETVNQTFFNTKLRARTKKGDILIASTGKGSLGKVVLNEVEQEMVVDGHVSIVRVNQNLYNNLFLCYFLQSVLGVFQIEREYTGATNQIELYSSEIENLEIPSLSLEEQERVVKKIKVKMDKQKEINEEIKKAQHDISNIFEKSLEDFIKEN